MSILGSSQYLVKRATDTPQVVDHRPVEPSYSEFIIYATVQPDDGRETVKRPTGDTTIRACKLYTETCLQPADAATTNVADIVVVDGREMEVHRTEWQRAIIPHYKCWLLERD